MNLESVNRALSNRITGGSEYQWSCYPNARYLDYETDYGHASVIFDSLTQEIYEATVEDKEEASRPYRWLNPVTKHAMFDEAESRGADKYAAWDDVHWTDLETEEDFLKKAAAILNGDEFDTRIEVPLELSDANFMALAKMAHERDITFNEMVGEILKLEIERLSPKKVESGCCGKCSGNE
jgi:hypothetical protein